MSEELDLSIDNYISDEFSICREERQYALYLSNVLRYYGKNPKHEKDPKVGPANRIGNNEEVEKIFEACGFDNLENIFIKNVFYEATFMRDVFERNRRYYLAKDKTEACLKVEYSKNPYRHKDYKISKNNSFNYKLLDYCIDIISMNRDNDEQSDQDEKSEDNIVISERNYGGKDNFISEEDLEKLKLKINKNDWKRFKSLVRAMMNAKPDIAVYYEQDQQLHLKFIECKFESKESTSNGFKQTEIQGHIAEFMHKYYFELGVDNMMDKGAGSCNSHKVEFCRDSETKRVVNREDNKDYSYGIINIYDLIESEKTIFE